MLTYLPTYLEKKVLWQSTRRARVAPVSQLALRRRRGRTKRSFPPPRLRSPIVTVFEKTSSLLVGCLVVYFSPKEKRQEGIAIPNEESVQ